MRLLTVFAVVAPSAPRNKRTVVNGICFVAGEPLSNTAVARDPFTPVTEARVSTLMERRFPGAVRELPLELVRGRKRKTAGLKSLNKLRSARGCSSPTRKRWKT